MSDGSYLRFLDGRSAVTIYVRRSVIELAVKGWYTFAIKRKAYDGTETRTHSKSKRIQISRFERAASEARVILFFGSDLMAASLTVILPNYNHSRFLARAISALQRQDLAPSEILIIDDASTDDSVAVIKRLATSCPAIRLLRNEHNLGTVPSLNRGISESQGKYIYFAAADDLVLPGFFSNALAVLEKYQQAAFSCGDCEIVNESGTVLAIRPPARPAQHAAYLAPCAIPCLLRLIDNWALTSTRNSAARFSSFGG